LKEFRGGLWFLCEKLFHFKLVNVSSAHWSFETSFCLLNLSFCEQRFLHFSKSSFVFSCNYIINFFFLFRFRLSRVPIIKMTLFHKIINGRHNRSDWQWGSWQLSGSAKVHGPYSSAAVNNKKVLHNRWGHAWGHWFEESCPGL
jgi:hypothetical protein